MSRTETVELKHHDKAHSPLAKNHLTEIFHGVVLKALCVTWVRVPDIMLYTSHRFA